MSGNHQFSSFPQMNLYMEVSWKGGYLYHGWFRLDLFDLYHQISSYMKSRAWIIIIKWLYRYLMTKRSINNPILIQYPIVHKYPSIIHSHKSKWIQYPSEVPWATQLRGVWDHGHDGGTIGPRDVSRPTWYFRGGDHGNSWNIICKMYLCIYI